MKKSRLLVLILTGIMVFAMLTGCGKSFDAAAYLTGILDNSYKGDSSKMVEQKVGSQEECQKLYEEGIEVETKAFLDAVFEDYSDDVTASFEEVFKKAFAAADYTVGKATEGDNKSYTVTVKYKKMSLFVPAYTNWYQQVTSEDYDGTDTEQMQLLLAQCFMDVLDSDVSFADVAETTVRIELDNKTYSPNSDDLGDLELLLFDIEELGNM